MLHCVCGGAGGGLELGWGLELVGKGVEVPTLLDCDSLSSLSLIQNRNVCGFLAYLQSPVTESV